MNGRIFDYNLGRFLSIDPFIQFPENSQSLNPYSYILNNPMSGTDPSGYVICDGEGGKDCSIGINEIEEIVVGEEGVFVSTADGSFQIANNGAQSAISGFLAHNANANFSMVSGTPGDISSRPDQIFTPADRETVLDFATGGSQGGDALAGAFLAFASESALGMGDSLVSAQGQANIEEFYRRAEELPAGQALLFLMQLKNPKKWFNKKSGGSDAPCPWGCFAAGTLVLTPDGYKAIEDIEVGDLVQARSDETGEIAWKPVTNEWVFENRELYELVVTAGDGSIMSIHATDDHKFWVDNEGWVVTLDLDAGDHFVAVDGEQLILESVQPTGRFETVYNLEVAEFHTYFVTEFDVWVHNCNGGRKGKQQRLRDLAEDDRVSSADRGWIRNEIRRVERGDAARIRNPRNSRNSPRGGTELAHERGREAAKGYGYEHANLQDRDLHRTQHRYDNYGRKNPERPPE